MSEILLEVADVARVLDLTPAAVRAIIKAGRLPIAVQTPRGTRLFTTHDVEQLVRERAARRAGQAAAR